MVTVGTTSPKASSLPCARRTEFTLLQANLADLLHNCSRESGATVFLPFRKTLDHLVLVNGAQWWHWTQAVQLRPVGPESVSLRANAEEFEFSNCGASGGGQRPRRDPKAHTHMYTHTSLSFSLCHCLFPFSLPPLSIDTRSCTRTHTTKQPPKQKQRNTKETHSFVELRTWLRVSFLSAVGAVACEMISVSSGVLPVWRDNRPCVDSPVS